MEIFTGRDRLECGRATSAFGAERLFLDAGSASSPAAG